MCENEKLNLGFVQEDVAIKSKGILNPARAQQVMDIIDEQIKRLQGLAEERKDTLDIHEHCQLAITIVELAERKQRYT